MSLYNLIKNYKLENSQENYNLILRELFTKCENLLLWLETKSIENGLIFKNSTDNNGNNYILTNTKEFILNKETEMLTQMTVKGVFELILSNNCNGLIIDLDDSNNQFVLLKEYIIKIFNEFN